MKNQYGIDGVAYDRWKLASPPDEDELTDEELDELRGDAEYDAMRDDRLTEGD